MTRDELFGQISAVLVDYFEVESDTIKPESQLYPDLDIDSIDAVDLLVQLRDSTGARIRPEQFKDVRTVNDVMDAILAL